MSALPVVLSPDEQVARVKAALAEAGYPGVEVSWDPEDGVAIMWDDGDLDVPDAVCWMAWETARYPQACWPCYAEDPSAPSMTLDERGPDHVIERCKRGDCSHPDLPRRPPRELLTPPARETITGGEK